MGRTGEAVYTKYGWETIFKDGASTKNKTFGISEKFTSVAMNQNVEKVFGLGSRYAQSLIPKQFEGALSVDFVLANPWWIRSVLGSVTDGGSAPYTHTFTATTSVKSVGVEIGGQFEDENVVKTLEGVIVGSATITTAINDFANVRLDCRYADQSVTTTTTSAVTETYSPYTFAHGSFESPTGTTFSEVQSAEITLNNNAQMLWGLGSYNPVEVVNKALDISGRVNLVVKNDTYYGYVTGRTEQATGKFKFTNGLTGSNERTIEFTLTGVMFGEYDSPVSPNEVVFQDLTFTARQVTAVAYDSTQTSL